ncbi:DUF4240 domain-containing protein [Streptomyces sp. NPDC060085]|uniref:DUF4240 domain-containing protein n=1 Tax=Streptomyces sp. NPDC060085 TaxID=3347054 RepID=UPI00366010D6
MRSRAWDVRRTRDPNFARASVIGRVSLMCRTVHFTQLWSWLVCPSHRARAGSAAAYLIGGGCSNDSFMDFRAGLIALGRDWYEKATADPDSLADHPAVIAAAAVHSDEIERSINFALCVATF